MNGIIERLRAWPASEGDALSAGFVGGMMSEAADTITELLAALETALPTGISLKNRNIPDSMNAPINATMGELRQIHAAIAKAKGGAA